MLALGLSRAEAKAIGRRYGQNALVWIGADAFYTWWDNMQADTLRPDGLIATRNAGYARIVGIEATLSHAFGPVWRITLWAIAQAALLIRHGLGIRAGCILACARSGRHGSASIRRWTARWAT